MSGHARILIVTGLAGSGKTTFTARFKDEAVQSDKHVYVVNLDPAVSCVPYVSNLDIRDTVKYDLIMDQGKMGPNGATLLALDLFTTKMHQMEKLLAGKCKTHDYIVIDTPGQIEMFTWSASGDILCKMLSQLPASSINLLYLIDNAKRTGNEAFVAGNMLHACSIKCRLQLPMTIVFTKCDLVSNAWQGRDRGQDECMTSDTYKSEFQADIIRSFSPLFESLRQVQIGMNDGKLLFQHIC